MLLFKFLRFKNWSLKLRNFKLRKSGSVCAFFPCPNNRFTTNHARLYRYWYNACVFISLQSHILIGHYITRINHTPFQCSMRAIKTFFFDWGDERPLKDISCMARGMISKPMYSASARSNVVICALCLKQNGSTISRQISQNSLTFRSVVSELQLEYKRSYVCNDLNSG